MYMYVNVAEHIFLSDVSYSTGKRMLRSGTGSEVDSTGEERYLPKLDAFSWAH